MSLCEKSFYGSVNNCVYKEKLTLEVCRARLLITYVLGLSSLYDHVNNFSNNYNLEECAKMRIDVYFNEKTRFSTTFDVPPKI